MGFMRLIQTLLIAALLSASSASADITITSVSPNSGPVAGGTTVSIKGSGFSNNCVICSPSFLEPQVFFGTVPAQSAHMVDSTTITAVTAAGFPATVPVTVKQLDGSGSFTLPNAFSFVGLPEAGFDPILFPIFAREVFGAFGSDFRTVVRVWDKGLFAGGARTLYGFDSSCLLNEPPLAPTDPMSLFQETQLPTDCARSTGRILYVPKGTAPSLAANTRVSDVSRQTMTLGVEIPAVHREEFSEERIALLGVPADSRFRNTLRIYSLARGNPLVNLTINGKGYQITLTRHDEQDLFEPAYAEFTAFPALGELPAGQTTFRVVIDTGRGPGGVVIPGTPIWGMVSVTNNQTQEITTITPN
jgi:hypothetical protein